MAHFAHINNDNEVINVIVVKNDVVNNLEFPLSEDIGVAFCKSLYGQETIWKQTSYNSSFRKNFAGIGYKYDINRDAFIPPSPYSSWVLNESSCTWESPVPYPDDGKVYLWNEPTISWIERA